MIPRTLPAETGADALRAVRALGAHRYVSGRYCGIHALAYDALTDADGGAPDPLKEAVAWAHAVLGDGSIEPDSKDERLVRSASPEELLLVLEAFWLPGARADRAHDRLLASMARLGLSVAQHSPFDEAVEEDVHPLLIDAGWELLRLSELDPERHRGVIEAFGEPILYEAARFEEDEAVPPRANLQELPAIGAVELLRGVDADGALSEPLVLWTQGDEVYQDYVLRGVLRAAKLGF